MFQLIWYISQKNVTCCKRNLWEMAVCSAYVVRVYEKLIVRIPCISSSSFDNWVYWKQQRPPTFVTTKVLVELPVIFLDSLIRSSLEYFLMGVYKECSTLSWFYSWNGFLSSIDRSSLHYSLFSNIVSHIIWRKNLS